MLHFLTPIPSKGSVSAYIRGSIKEGGREGPIFDEDDDDLYEAVVFSESTAVSGDISTFAKAMSYSSVFG